MNAYKYAAFAIECLELKKKNKSQLQKNKKE